MGRPQKGKHHKRKRSWHRRGGGPDRAFASAIRRIERALRSARTVIRSDTDEGVSGAVEESA